MIGLLVQNPKPAGAKPVSVNMGGSRMGGFNRGAGGMGGGFENGMGSMAEMSAMGAMGNMGMGGMGAMGGYGMGKHLVPGQHPLSPPSPAPLSSFVAHLSKACYAPAA